MSGKPSGIEIFRRYESPGTKTFAVSSQPPLFVRGQGALLFDIDDRAYLDFACGSGTTVLGHGHPAITQALTQQAASGILHVGPHFHTPSQAGFMERLLALLPAGLDRLQPATNGTEATEAALKIAMHATGHRRFITFEGAYHGRTLGALAVSPARGANAALGPFSPEITALAYPSNDMAGCLDLLDAALARLDGEFAGLLIEPIQATAGMRMAAPRAMALIAAFARRRSIPLIVDEVFTGFGRSGAMFASTNAGLDPDLLILAKSLGGGIPAGLVAGRAALMDKLPAGAQSSTFQLHPLAAATGSAMLDEMSRCDLSTRALEIGDWIGGALSQCAAQTTVAGYRGIGAMWGVEIGGPDAKAKTRSIRAAALQAGLVTWECGLDAEVIGLVPPLIVERDQVERAMDILFHAISTTA